MYRYSKFCFLLSGVDKDITMVADAVIYHPTVAHYLRFVATTGIAHAAVEQNLSLIKSGASRS